MIGRSVNRNQNGSEHGQVLILVLVFVLAFGLLISAILGLVTSNLKTTQVVRSRTERAYAVDAGIEGAIARMRIDSTVCATPNQTLPPVVLNGRTAEVTCEMRNDGSVALGASGWAAIILGDITQSLGGNATVNGPLYVQGNIGGDIVNENGSVLQRTCTSDSHQGLLVRPNPPYSWQCTTMPPPTVPHKLPPVPPLSKPADSFPDDCKVFYPGTYKAKPALAGRNYFVNGVYYFENIGAWEVPTFGLITGGSNPEDETEPLTEPCVEGAELIPGGTGQGVEWIFGGSSRLSFKNKGAIELHSRVPDPAEGDVTPGISFVAVPDTHASDPSIPVGYLASDPNGAADPFGTVFNTSGGHPEVAIHGLFYAPKTDAALDGPNGLSVFRGGAVIHDADIRQAHEEGTPIFSVGTSSKAKRYVVITAKAYGKSGEAPVIATAVVEVSKPPPPDEATELDNSQRVIVRSWRTH